MKKMIFIAFILTGQMFAQIENGLYYSEDIYRSDVDNHIAYNTTKMETSQYLDITSDGIRIYPPGGLGFYHAWKSIDFFDTHYTYILTNGTKVCVGPEINGIYYFYEDKYNAFEYKKLIEFRNMIKIPTYDDNAESSKDGNYIMEIE